MTRIASRLDRAEQPDAPWIVLLNSLAADTRMWDGQIAALTRRYHALRIDTRGHGASEASPAPYSFDLLVGDVLSVLDREGIGRATFLGLSLGGMTGLHIALAHPERMETLVCCDARADMPPPGVQGWNERIAAVEAQGMEAILQGTLGRWLTAGFRAANPQAVAVIEDMIRTTAPAGYIGCAEAIKRLDILKDLHRITVPTLFVVGSEDVAAPPSAMEEMASRLPGARFALVQDAAHLPNVDNAAGFHRAVAGFLGL